MRWPFRSAVLDGEVCAGNGMDGIASVFEARGRADGDTALCFFDPSPSACSSRLACG